MSSLRIVALALLGFLVIAGNADAGQARVDRMVAAFERWAADNATGASLAVIEGGRVAATDGYGSYDADNVSPLGSLSKMVTAMCIARLVEDGKLTFQTRLVDALPAEYFERHPLGDDAEADVTIAGLLTHTSGLHYDATQGEDMQQFLPYTEPSLEDQVDVGLGGMRQQQKYFYNNINYATLGLIVEKMTGETHDVYCNKAVLQPAGITSAKMNAELLARGPYGAWMMTAADYARLLAYLDPRSGLLSIPQKNWPKGKVNDRVQYSLGVDMRRQDNGYVFWHSGAYSARGGPSYGAYFVRWPSGVGYVATYTPRPSDDALDALVNAMGRASK
jgi:CubicO group peptidase (beta-lactamase class C family)